MLHFENHLPQDAINSEIQTSTLNHFSKNNSRSHILLATALICIKNSKGEFIEARCLPDSGSQSNFIMESLCSKLNISKITTNFSIVGINQTASQINEQANVRIFSKTNNFIVDLSC